MARFEITVPVDPARACPNAGSAGPCNAEELDSWFLW